MISTTWGTAIKGHSIRKFQNHSLDPKYSQVFPYEWETERHGHTRKKKEEGSYGSRVEDWNTAAIKQELPTATRSWKSWEWILPQKLHRKYDPANLQFVPSGTDFKLWPPEPFVLRENKLFSKFTKLGVIWYSCSCELTPWLKFCFVHIELNTIACSN